MTAHLIILDVDRTIQFMYYMPKTRLIFPTTCNLSKLVQLAEPLVVSLLKMLM